MPADNYSYWHVFWEEPESSIDIYELLTSYDIKTIRDQNPTNFVLIIRVLTLRLIFLAEHESFPSKAAPISELLNCIRFLTKLLPFLFEMPKSAGELEDILFWSESFDAMSVVKGSPASLTRPVTEAEDCRNAEGNMNGDKILGANLVKCLVNLLFIKLFTMDVPKDSNDKKSNNRALNVWEPGIGATSKYQIPNIMIDSNRAEVLKLILTLTSTSFYQLPSHAISTGSKFLTVLVTITPRVELLILVCSLMNLMCRSARSAASENMLVFNNIHLTEMRHLCVTYAAQLLTVMVVYPLPSQPNLKFLFDLGLLDNTKPYNMARVYMGKLHKENELLFLASYLINILRMPMQSAKDNGNLKFNLTANRQNNQPSLWCTESTMLLWELFQCNKAFRRLVGEHYLHEFFIIMLYYIHTHYNNPNYKNSVRIFSYLMLYLSSDYSIMDKLFGTIDPSFYESLPNSFKISPTPITYRDFIVTQICNLLISMCLGVNNSNIPKSKSCLLLTTLVEILYNLIPVVSSKDNSNRDYSQKKLSNTNPNGGLSYAACSAITQVITKFSTRSFLLETSFNADLLALILRSICTAIIKYPKSSRMLLFCILKHEKVYDKVWSTIYSFNSEHFIGDTLRSNPVEDTEEAKEDGDPQEVESHGMDDLSINSSNESDLTEAAFINSLGPHLSSNSVISEQTSQNTDGGVYDSEYESLAIDTAFRPRPPTGMSQKARDKLPKETPLKRSWGGNDSLRIILTIIIPHLKLVLKEVWSSREGPSIDSFLLIKQIENTEFENLIAENKRQINYDFLPNTPLEPLKFNWSHLSLGWYISLLYGSIYNAVDNVKIFTGNNNKIMKNLSTSFVNFSKFTSTWTGMGRQDPIDMTINDSNEATEWVEHALTSINHWSHTTIKLFRIEPIVNESIFGSINSKVVGNTQGVPNTPSVNDMTTTLVRKFSDFRVRNSSTSSMSSLHSGNSILGTPIEEQESNFGKYIPRNSVSSLHSMNTLNRSRTNTPRNSISM